MAPPPRGGTGKGGTAPQSAVAADGEVRYWQTDLPQDKKRVFLEAVRLLYKRIVQCRDCTKEEEKANKKMSKAERWDVFALALQSMLERGTPGSAWHVLIGESIGFACKKRNKSMAAFRVEDDGRKVVIVCWRSPGIEKLDDAPSPSAAPPAEPAAGEGDATCGELDELAAAKPAKALKLRVLQPTDKVQLEEGSGPARAILAIGDVLGTLPQAEAADVQKVAQAVRKRLTTELGTIWHVCVGCEFVVQPGGSVRNFVHVVSGKSHIVCFQHEQFEGKSIDWQRLLSALPYAFLTFFCMAYMTVYSVCGDTEPAPSETFKLKLRRNVCTDAWDRTINFVGGATLVVFFVSKKSHLFFKSSKLKVA